MARRTDHTAEELRALILNAAEQIIVEQGASALSTRAVARQIGYTTGTLYQHFEDIHDIVLNVNARTMQGLVEALVKASKSLPEAPVEQIHGYADVYLTYIEENQNAWDAMFSRRREPGERAPEWYQAHIDKLVGMVETCFAALNRDGAATSPDAAARMLWASVHGVCALETTGRLGLIMRNDLNPLVHSLVDVHLAAFQCV
ncbi:MAG: TetR/AcrR family transcriptional regulator [Alphaproteobacteria bacterium]|nr:TetR/AcrR family transcriptional regulator [Alphaproteobacteria bacterium]